MKLNRYKWLLFPVLAIVTFAITELAPYNRHFVEVVYSQAVYPVVASALSAISTIFPFSLDDIFYVFLVVGAVVLLLFLVFRKIAFKRAGKIVLNFLAAVYLFFYLFWGFNYYRENVNSRLNIAEQKPDTEEFLQQLEWLISATNQSYCKFNNFDKPTIDSLVEVSYKKCSRALKLKYPAGWRKDKGITFSRFFASAGISGYFGPFFNEVHVNTNILPIEYPFVLAHEKAHQFGVTSEAEANFYGWLVCSQSNSKQLRYSANLYVLKFFLFQAVGLNGYKEIVLKLNKNVKDDFLRIQKHWDKLQNEKINRVASKVNDTYLKTNKVAKGVDDYYGVVKFVMDFRLDSAFHEKYGLSFN